MEYTDSKLFDRVPLRMTLSTAQKYLSKLKAAQGSGSAKGRKAQQLGWYGSPDSSSDWTTPHSTLDFTSASTMKPTYDIFTKHVEEQISAARQKYDQRFVISYDISVLKDAIFAMNAECGVSLILSQIEFFNAQVANLKNVLKKTLTSIQPTDFDTIKFLYLKNSSSDATTTSKSINVATFSSIEINDKIKKLTRKLSDLEAQRDKLNATRHITVLLSAFSRAELGLIDDDGAGAVADE